MYQCASFYTANRLIPENSDTIVAAWAVTADDTYYYDMAEDTLVQANMYCFIRTIDGEGLIQTIKGSFLLPQNTYIFLPREDILFYKTSQKIWSYYWVDFIFLEKKRITAYQTIYADFSQKEKELFEELIQVGVKHPNELSYINGIFAHYYFDLHFKNETAVKTEKHSLRFSEVRAYMEQKLYSHLTVGEVANFFGVSPRRIHQIFYENIQMSPKQYISQLKMKKAKQILAETSVSIVDIADVLGYDSPYHFSSAFRKSEGCAPSTYRKGQSKK